ncbi:MAG: alpha/beta hydrolase [Clostridiales bacterium]|nr:alpha/beta hydrolase [Clostridiales bacterium]
MSDVLNPDFLVAAPDYAGAMDSVVLPALAAIEKVTELTAPDGTRLYCVSYPAEKPLGTVLVLHGFTENAFKYSELIYSLVRNGFSVLAYDQRGHGRSARAEGVTGNSVTHVDHFSDYVEDLRLVCDQLLNAMPRPWSIFCHSMGGAVTALYLEKYPDTFTSAVMCAPMIAPNTGGFPPALTLAFCGTAAAIGRGKKHPFFLKEYAGPEKFEDSCATDPARFAWYDAVKASRPEFQNSVPSHRWTVEGVRVTKQILAEGAPESIHIPVMLSTAEKDYSVMPEPQYKFISRVPDGTHVFVRDARHEIFRSVNEVFFPWWHDVLAFLKNAAERGPSA